MVERGIPVGSHTALPSYRPTLLPPYRHTAIPPIIAASPSMRRAVELARRYAPLDLPILLVGPTGTGKEVLAQAIHRWSGRQGELMDVNCGALHGGTVINELFGHRKGAYTGAVETVHGILEAANRGTLFLDELNSMPMEGQGALLRVVETGEVYRGGDTTRHPVSIRLIGAVQEVPSAGSEGPVRRDLIHRLAGGVIQLRPLSGRGEDLWPLAVHFAAQLGRTLAHVALPVLERYGWPGNVRELRHVVTRAASLEDGETLSAAVMAEAIDLGATRDGWFDTPLPLSTAEQVQARHDLEGLCREHGGRPGAIAAAAGMSRATLYRRLQQFGLKLTDHRDGGAASQRLTVS